MMRQAIRELSYNRWIRSWVRAAGLHERASRAYLRAFGGPNREICLRVGGQQAWFSTRTPSEMRVLESIAVREAALPQLLASVRAGDRVLDVGAHSGLYAVFLAQAAGPAGMVLAAEPDSRSLQRLQLNLARNGVQDRVTTVEAALGDQSGEVDLCLVDESMAAIGSVATGTGTLVRVTMRPGDQVVAEAGWDHPNVIKVDVEGFEFSVLQGLRQSLEHAGCRVVCCEVHPTKLPAGVTCERIVNFLSECGLNQIRTLPCPPEMHLLASRRAASGG